MWAGSGDGADAEGGRPVAPEHCALENTLFHPSHELAPARSSTLPCDRMPKKNQRQPRGNELPTAIQARHRTRHVNAPITLRKWQGIVKYPVGPETRSE